MTFISFTPFVVTSWHFPATAVLYPAFFNASGTVMQLADRSPEYCGYGLH